MKSKLKNLRVTLAKRLLKGTNLSALPNKLHIVEKKLDVKVLTVSRRANKYMDGWTADDIAREIGNLIKRDNLWEYEKIVSPDTDVAEIKAVVRVVVGKKTSYSLENRNDV